MDDDNIAFAGVQLDNVIVLFFWIGWASALVAARHDLRGPVFRREVVEHEDRIGAEGDRWSSLRESPKRKVNVQSAGRCARADKIDGKTAQYTVVAQHVFMQCEHLRKLDHLLVNAPLVHQVPYPLCLPVEINVFSAACLFRCGQLGRAIAQCVGPLRGQSLFEHDVTVFIEMGDGVL